MALVKQWISKITAAKAKWEPDFKRMRKNMEFVSGLQWPGQKTLDSDWYVNNVTLRMVNQKVASLYAKNPTAVATRRQRLDFAIWNGETESLMEAMGQAQQIVDAGMPLPPDLADFFKDVEEGRMRQHVTDKIGKTLEIVYGHAVDSQKPEFKQQLKQCVRRAVICGVAYGRPIFCRESEAYNTPSSIDTKSGPNERAGRAQEIINRIEDGTVEQDSATTGTLKSLAASLGAMQERGKLPEKLEFDFCLSTAIIPDPRCRSLVDFVAARWIAQEYVLPVAEVNAIFGTSINIGNGGESGAKEVNTSVGVEGKPIEAKDDIFSKQDVCLYEVFDYTTKTRFFVCDGWKDFVLAPEPVSPSISGFWHHFALTFNELEVDPESKTSIFPPSDVQTMKSPQMEWNRTREDLRDHRRANSPRYIYRDGTISAEDLTKLVNAEPNSATALKSVPADMPLDKVIMAMPMMPIDPKMYETASSEQDIMLGGGMQQANLGPAQPNVTATVGTIAEQSRMNVSASNIDDLDGFLSRLAQAGGEMLLLEMSEEVVRRIAGVGAVWPSQDETREDYLNEVFLKIEAASSGRPNKAVDIANWRDLAPLLMQSGANPVGLIEETAKRLDDTLDTSSFFPLTPPSGASSQGGGQSPPSGEPTQGGSNGPPQSPAPSQGLDNGSGQTAQRLDMARPA
jgi:hypothetical protein